MKSFQFEALLTFVILDHNGHWIKEKQKNINRIMHFT